MVRVLERPSLPDSPRGATRGEFFRACSADPGLLAARQRRRQLPDPTPAHGSSEWPSAWAAAEGPMAQVRAVREQSRSTAHTPSTAARCWRPRHVRSAHRRRDLPRACPHRAAALRWLRRPRHSASRRQPWQALAGRSVNVSNRHRRSSAHWTGAVGRASRRAPRGCKTLRRENVPTVAGVTLSRRLDQGQ